MGYYEMLSGNSIEINLEADYQDNGWRFFNGEAIHERWNSGSIFNKVFSPVPNKEYEVTISVRDMSGGSLEFWMGGTLFFVITSNGTHRFTGTTVSDDPITLTATSHDMVVYGLSISEGINEGVTVVYDINSKQYNGNVSFNGDMMSMFLDDLVSFKNGVPWVHDMSDARNTFYGVKYPSVVTFYCNVEYDKDKDFYSLTINGSESWRVDVSLPPRQGKTRGQKSRIKKDNFRFEKGKYVAEFLRDMSDPRFDSEIQALMKGAYLQGRMMEVTLTNDSDKLVELITVEVDVSVK